MNSFYGELDAKETDLLFKIFEVIRGVFPGMRDDVSVRVSNPVFMGPKERSRLKTYQVVDGDLVYDFTAYLVTYLDDSQALCIAKYEVNGREITHLVSRVYGGGR